MPNSRRRKFSVQNEIKNRETTKSQNGTQVRASDTDDGANKNKNKSRPNTSKRSSILEMVVECENTISTTAYKKEFATNDKDVTASSSNIDLFNILSAADGNISNKFLESKEHDVDMKHTREKFQSRRDKHPRQHRIKVRSPKRKPLVIDKVEGNKRSIGSSIDWNEEETAEVEVAQAVLKVEADVIENVEEQERPSNYSMDDMCRICHGGESLTSELGSLISACSCRGTVGRVHVKCLERWLTESGKSRCELCGTRYSTRRVHRYGIMKALVMWILSQNAKQLMVDSLGIMLMSPLAVLAAWLSGRTLAGLMTQEAHVTPWPLASTFVLACMTLVCYYCWIVSAATRHALGWWIWYRSQYEVRLQIDQVD
ncbi:uncharacterized protein LOC123710935 isoform X3 [Pieris brassicae]|uniref:RING-CH-type domain-containing protein n=1 Tax=Pieris brassicae TaxID=7116 RepID=A0A9P0TYR0_PIEBR|nr:uncharacterized protein LOC123710935 isoform X2 [Pieris brassicae]XP_045519230.1 uncharacterized protein LOC123710935 isoform X3 [Pieris brassicae]CAH4038253.1 unnamed protein product [Pieris brassicae]